MEFVADLLLVSAAIGAAVYCFVLSNRLKRFTDLDKGVGGAVAVLSAQVDDLQKALKEARAAAEATRKSTDDQVRRAEAAGRRLELLIASMNDVELEKERAR